MFHARQGLFFQREPDGAVRVTKTVDGQPPAISWVNVVCDVALAEHEWASVVASVSKTGETTERWQQALTFHRS